MEREARSAAVAQLQRLTASEAAAREEAAAALAAGCEASARLRAARREARRARADARALLSQHDAWVVSAAAPRAPPRPGGFGDPGRSAQPAASVAALRAGLEEDLAAFRRELAGAVAASSAAVAAASLARRRRTPGERFTSSDEEEEEGMEASRSPSAD